MTIKTIKIQGRTLKPRLGLKNNRKAHIRYLCEKLPEDLFKTLSDEQEGDSDYLFMFDTDLLKFKRMENAVTEVVEKDFTNSIFDISEDLFNHPEEGLKLLLCTGCAKHITCSSPYMQEVIYENTGRFASIIETPLIDEDFETPDSNKNKNIISPSILWFGLKEDVFSIKKIQQEHKNLPITTIDNTLANRLSKELMNRIGSTDIVFLPKTFSETSEANRITKVVWSTLKGKFVIAPDLPEPYSQLTVAPTLNLGINTYKVSNIEDIIRKKQHALKKIRSEKNSVNQLHSALDLALDDDFSESFSYYLMNEEDTN